MSYIDLQGVRVLSAGNSFTRDMYIFYGDRIYNIYRAANGSNTYWYNTPERKVIIRERAEAVVEWKVISSFKDLLRDDEVLYKDQETNPITEEEEAWLLTIYSEVHTKKVALFGVKQ